jgi:UPF0755 protein
MYIKRILWAVALIGLVAMGSFAYFVYDQVFSPNTAFDNQEAHVYIPTGAGMSQVMEELGPLLENTTSFERVARRKKYFDNIKSGHFVLTPGMNNNDIVNTIRSGNVPVRIKFNNQERLEDLAGALARQMEADSLSFLEAMNQEEWLRQNGFNKLDALGMYLPNTYEVYWNESPAEFVLRMKREYDAFWNEDRLRKASEKGLDPKQVMSLAAIVHKETAKVDERPRVAGLYLNRLDVGMPLQADPTIIYAKKLKDNDFDQQIKRVLYADLEIDSPYNTYKNQGLPPGPITMPDLSAVEAVLNPEVHRYLYMVVDVENFGYHKFASSLREHNRNKAEYVRWINKQGINR